MIVKKFMSLDEAVDPPVTHYCETLNYMPKKGAMVKALCGCWIGAKQVNKPQNLCPKCKKAQTNILNRPIAKNREGILAKEDAAFAGKD